MKWLLTILLLGSLYGQGFGYNYIDPCNQQAVNLNYTTETTANGFWVTYYNKRAFFTWIQVADGTLQAWTQQVYRDFEKLFPCAVNIAEEALASASTINLTDELEREDEEDIGASEPSFIGGDIVNTFYDYGSVATFNSVYTQENFDLTKEFNYTLNITLDLKKVLGFVRSLNQKDLLLTTTINGIEELFGLNMLLVFLDLELMIYIPFYQKMLLYQINKQWELQVIKDF